MTRIGFEGLSSVLKADYYRRTLEDIEGRYQKLISDL